MSRWSRLWINANLATMADTGQLYGAVRSAALASRDGHIAWVGPMSDLPDRPERLADRVEDLGDRWLTPGLIDCHTHLVFGGSRAGEFERRLQGASYEEIARAGGGIVSTMRATRSATEHELVKAARPRLANLLGEGVTTVEIKSGYGLNTETELKQLSAARQLGDLLPVDVRTTFLGAHALPPEFGGRQSDYIDLVIDEMLPAAAQSGTADAVDAFCESIAFTPAETEAVFKAAGKYELPVKLHAEQLSDQGGAALAAQYGALSADHLEYVSEAGVKALAEANTVAVLLPGAFYTLRETRVPPVELLRRYEVDIAIATDFNPGSSPVLSILLTLNLACTLFRLTPEEALAGVTRNAARALGLGGDRGTLEVGKRTDLAIWDIDEPAELSYWAGHNLLERSVRLGSDIDTAVLQAAS